MKIGFVGAGKVGRTLGQYFAQHHMDVCGYYSRSVESAGKGAREIGGSVFFNLDEIIETAGMIWITVTDDAIQETVSQMVSSRRIRKEHILVHTSGAHGTDVFQELKDVGCGLYSIHPLQSFADTQRALQVIPKTYFTMEGNEIHFSFITDMFNVLGNPYTVISKSQKELYHAGACVFSNYLVTLMSAGFDFIRRTGFPEDEIYPAFEPLIQSTLENIRERGPAMSLTGPISRGDVTTIEKHLVSIEKNMDEELEFYKFMGRKTLDMIEKGKRLNDEHENIRNLLMEG